MGRRKREGEGEERERVEGRRKSMEEQLRGERGRTGGGRERKNNGRAQEEERRKREGWRRRRKRKKEEEEAAASADTSLKGSQVHRPLLPGDKTHWRASKSHPHEPGKQRLMDASPHYPVSVSSW